MNSIHFSRWSPSTRRAWIEISDSSKNVLLSLVALHPEGVDRNANHSLLRPLPKGSPSTRRAWIEIFRMNSIHFSRWSPSTRRAWIEISDSSKNVLLSLVALHPEGVDRNANHSLLRPLPKGSPSTRRAWIEIIRPSRTL